MRDKLIEDLKGFRTPICEGLNAKLPYAEELADYLLENGVIKELIEQYEKLLNEFKSAPLGRFEFEILYKEKCTQLDVANRCVVELLADKEFSKINRTEFKKMIVSEMQERLTNFFSNDDTLKYVEVDAEYINECIEQITKEMLEGKNEN